MDAKWSAAGGSGGTVTGRGRRLSLGWAAVVCLLVLGALVGVGLVVSDRSERTPEVPALAHEEIRDEAERDEGLEGIRDKAVLEGSVGGALAAQADSGEAPPRPQADRSAVAGNDAATAYRLGLSLRKEGRNVEAEDAFRRVLEVQPGHVKSLTNLARVLLDEGRADEALRLATMAARIGPASGDAHRVRGRAFHTLGVAPEAIACYEEAIALDNRDAWALNNLGLLFIEAGRFDDAVAPLARATRISDGVAHFHNNLGIALERTGRFGAAADAFARALQIDGTYAKAGENLARVSVQKDDPARSPLDLEALAAAYPVPLETSRVVEHATNEAAETRLRAAR